MGYGRARSDEAASARYFGAAVLAALGLAVFLSVAPSPDAAPAPATATHTTSVSPAS
jgi:hypothetical protein